MTAKKKSKKKKNCFAIYPNLLVDDDEIALLAVLGRLFVADRLLEVDDRLDAGVNEGTLGGNQLLTLRRRLVEETRVDLAAIVIIIRSTIITR